MVVTFEPSLTQLLTLVYAFGIPVLVGLVTKYSTSGAVKAVLLAGLSLVGGVVSDAIAAATAGTQFDLFGSLYAFGTIFIVATASHFGLWKPTGVSAAVQSVGSGEHVAR